jgi:hypothetical protein
VCSSALDTIDRFPGSLETASRAEQHFWPLRAGGSNEPENLWYHPAENEWNKESFGFRKRIVLNPNCVKTSKLDQSDSKEAYRS